MPIYCFFCFVLFFILKKIVLENETPVGSNAYILMKVKVKREEKRKAMLWVTNRFRLIS